MDPQASVSSQKTSPQRDPAALTQLTLSAQANQLAIHQHQLTRLTALTEELVRSLQGLSLSPPAPAATQDDIPVNIPNHPPPPVSPHLAFPERFNGDSTMCKGFLLQCSLFVTQQPALACTPMTPARLHLFARYSPDRALDWVTAVWRGDGSAFPSFDFFLQRFKEVFDHPAGGRGAGEQLLALSQGRTTAAEYALAFRTLAAQTTWVEDTHKLLFRRGLNMELQAELACRNEGRNLSDFIELTIQIDNLIRSRRFPRSPSFNPSPPVSNPEPMQIGYTHLSSEERERRVRLHLCMYCGQAGHLRSSCPVRPASATPRAVSPIFPYKSITSCIKVPVTLFIGQRTVSTEALIGLRGSGQFHV